MIQNICVFPWESNGQMIITTKSLRISAISAGKTLNLKD